MKRCLLYSGGYESTYASLRYPAADKIFISYPNVNSDIINEMEKRNVRIVISSAFPAYMTLQGILIAKGLGYDEVIICNEDERDFIYKDDILCAEGNEDFLEKIEKHLQIKIINACENLSHSDIIKRVIRIVKQEDILTCDKWQKNKPRCYECYKCKKEQKVLKDL